MESFFFPVEFPEIPKSYPQNEFFFAETEKKFDKPEKSVYDIFIGIYNL